MIFRTNKLGKVYIVLQFFSFSSSSLSLLVCYCSTRRICLAAHEPWDGIGDFDIGNNGFDNLGATTSSLCFGFRRKFLVKKKNKEVIPKRTTHKYSSADVTPNRPYYDLLFTTVSILDRMS